MTRLLATAALAAAALAVPAHAAPAKQKPCKPPKTGFHACLTSHYTANADGTVSDLRVTATLVHAVDACPDRVAARRVTITSKDDGTRLDAVRRRGSCRRGVERWRVVFSPGETAVWQPEPVRGTTLVARWQGAPGTTSLTLRGGNG